MPGMGGWNASRNFILNCEAWKQIPDGTHTATHTDTRLAPITGAVENVGYPDEKQFYFDLIRHCADAGVKLSIGDGTPDFKLQYGIAAVKEVQTTHPGIKAAVFIKPYPNDKIFERIDWADGVSEIGGIDIDAYNIITMRNLVHLEKKDASKLSQLKQRFNGKGLQFAIKGIFTDDDIAVVKEVKPDIVYISNHGGRVENRIGSTAHFLEQNAEILRQNCGELWIDGGIRTDSDAAKAASYGVTTILKARPFITEVCKEYQKQHQS